MLIAGYEKDFNESLRYWRTRFVVIPTIEPPPMMSGSSNDKLNEEEVRILGIDKLAEMFSRVRWQSLEDKNATPPSIRFLPTTLGPVMSVMDDILMAKLEEIHATGPLRKKPNSQRELASTSLATIAKLMREDDGVPIKNQHWHSIVYPDSFTGFDFVSWLVREFWDVSTRANAAEWGVKLQQQGLFEHCRGHHGFLDG
jgi:DEP domain-containing protein 5